MHQLNNRKLLVVGLASGLLFFGVASANASSASVSRAYNASGSIASGNLVSLETGRSDYVQAANLTNANRILGVVVGNSDSLLAINSGLPGNITTVQVVTSGPADTLVSTVNGAITVGDQVAASDFNGIGMKASPGSRVIGLAQSSFSDTSSGAMPQSVTGKHGTTKQITVGYINLVVAPGTAATQPSSSQLNDLQKLAKSLTGHTIPTLRIIISIIIAITAFISLAMLIYSSIYGSIISIGRNPLARYAVLRMLSSVMAMALLLAAVSSVFLFFLLR